LLVNAKLAKSKGEARRLVQQGGVSFFPAGEASGPQHVRDVDFIVPMIDGAVLKVGKLHYIKIRV
jgi:tyrosyl-tRNA synthetase